MDYRELWSDPSFLEMVSDYVEAHVAKCDGWDFGTAMSEPKNLAAEAHKIAGSAGMYGFPDVGDTARALEIAIRENAPVSEAQSLFEDLKNRILNAKNELAEYSGR